MSEIENTDNEWAEDIDEKYFSRGLIRVEGPPGSGMDLFVQHTKWKMKKYFGKHVLLDDCPKKLFEPYLPFNEVIAKNFIAQQRKTEIINIPIPYGMFPYTERYGKVNR